MAKIKGSETPIIMKLGTTGGTYGTAVAASTGDKIACKITPSITRQELTISPIGSNIVMSQESQAGRVTPVVSISGDAGYQSGVDKVFAQFFGAVTAPAEQTVGEDDYMHRFTLNSTSNAIYNTFAYKLASGDTLEFPSCAVRSLSLSVPEVHSIMQYTAELLGNKAELSSAVNTAAVVAAATIANSEVITVAEDDDFWINVSSAGALSSGDQFNITSYNVTLNRPMDFIGNVKGSAGNAAPVDQDIVSGTLSVTLQEQADKTYWTAWDVGTVYKSRFNAEGTQIGAGVNKAIKIYLPLMKLIDPPDYSVTEAGFNTVTLNFNLYAAAANPTGMSSTYPYIELINDRSTTYIA